MRLKKNIKEIKWMAKYAKQIWIYLLLFVFLSMIISLCGVAFSLASRTVIDTAMGSDQSELLGDCLMMFGLIVIQLALQAFGNLLSVRVSVGLDSRLKKNLFEAILQKDFQDITRFHSGDLMTRVTSDIGIVSSGIIDILPNLAALVTQIIAAFVVLLTFDATFAVIALMIGPAVVLFGLYYSRQVKKLHIRCQESDSAARSFIQEALQNLLVIKAFTREETSVDTYQKALFENNRLQIRKNKFTVIGGTGLSLGFWMGYLFAIGWGAYRLSTGFITFGTMTAFLQLVGQIQSPFHGMARTFPRIFFTLASASRIMVIEELQNESESGAVAGDMPDEPQLDRLTIQNLCFSYGRNAVLTNVDLNLKRGEFAMIAGPSGEGKTTLFRILLGLLKPSSGCVSLNFKNGDIIPAGIQTRRYFSYVPQGNTLLSGTIEENIRYGRLDAAKDELVACAKAACIYTFIMEQPDGWNTKIGERGVGLSEGQAQRIAIARALLRNAPLLLLDEATSALDEATEQELLEHLQAFAKDRICLFVSHRESINKACGRTFYLKDTLFSELEPESEATCTA